MKISYTNRGFELIEFVDDNGEACQLQQSSAMGVGESPGTSNIWLGQANGLRMHLDQDQVRDLVAHLKRWIDTGSFRKRRRAKR